MNFGWPFFLLLVVLVCIDGRQDRLVVVIVRVDLFAVTAEIGVVAGTMATWMSIGFLFLRTFILETRRRTRAIEHVFRIELFAYLKPNFHLQKRKERKE